MERHINFEDQQFSIIEAAQHLRVSRSFIYKLIAAKTIQPRKLGSRTIISGAELKRVAEGAA